MLVYILDSRAIPFTAEKVITFGTSFRKQENKRGTGFKSELDSKKERQRNLVPAKTGFIILILGFFNFSFHYFFITSQKQDVYTRSYIVGFWLDLLPCFISPLIVVFEAPVIRRKIPFIQRLIKRKEKSKSEALKNISVPGPINKMNDDLSCKSISRGQ